MATNTAAAADGAYQRHASKHRGSAVTPEAGRYHLHVALACPWADGALSMLFLKGLEDSISYSVVHPTWQRTRPDDPSDAHCGWVYRAPGDEPLKNPLGHGSFDCDDALIPDPSGAASIRDVYAACGDTEGPFTTPALFDKQTGTLVSNESMDILQLLNKDFDALAKHPERNFYPEALDADLKALNEATVYPSINNGVYRCGFAKSQAAYDKAVGELFGALEDVNERLGTSRFLGGDQFSWLDLRLFHTLVRFDPVYTCYFKTNVKLLKDHEHLLGFVRDVYQSIEPVRRAVNMKHIKTHYYTSHPLLNTYGIIPASDGPDLSVPHGRGPADGVFFE
eukprot:CAMPEP_0119272894 /NCGR_PEP_ID=MMETSP1329-20130426/9135_1 /TAXON_ID=114041 /ORGANISM="Genus nov. species nov., Strain RCC1024" /LENGTH=336 /DNA_ID=CAMNT_0007273007 /DNA_START=215 /DNA_END=1225 /DNA_ORIENTATION=+